VSTKLSAGLKCTVGAWGPAVAPFGTAHENVSGTGYMLAVQKFRRDQQ